MSRTLKVSCVKILLTETLHSLWFLFDVCIRYIDLSFFSFSPSPFFFSFHPIIKYDTSNLLIQLYNVYVARCIRRKYHCVLYVLEDNRYYRLIFIWYRIKKEKKMSLCTFFEIHKIIRENNLKTSQVFRT